jgi:hypothetical protein
MSIFQSTRTGTPSNGLWNRRHTSSASKVHSQKLDPESTQSHNLSNWWRILREVSINTKESPPYPGKVSKNLPNSTTSSSSRWTSPDSLNKEQSTTIRNQRPQPTSLSTEVITSLKSITTLNNTGRPKTSKDTRIALSHLDLNSWVTTFGDNPESPWNNFPFR